MSLNFRNQDVEMQFYHHPDINKSGVKLTHIPTGTVSQCCEHSSVERNKKVAIKQLRELVIKRNRRLH